MVILTELHIFLDQRREHIFWYHYEAENAAECDKIFNSKGIEYTYKTLVILLDRFVFWLPFTVVTYKLFLLEEGVKTSMPFSLEFAFIDFFLFSLEFAFIEAGVLIAVEFLDGVRIHFGSDASLELERVIELSRRQREVVGQNGPPLHLLGIRNWILVVVPENKYLFEFFSLIPT